MSYQLSPYLALDGTTREAMEFYQSVLGGELTMMTFAEAGAGDFPGSDRIMHASLTTAGGLEIFGADTLAEMGHTAGDTVALSLMGNDDALPGLFAAAARNTSRSIDDLAIFECGSAFLANDKGAAPQR